MNIFTKILTTLILGISALFSHGSSPSFGSTYIPINQGGTATTTGGVTNGIYRFNGTTFTNDYNFNYNGTNVGIGTTTPYALLSIGNTNGIGFTTATSTFNTTGGIQIINGCYAMADGTCIQQFIQNATAYKQAVAYATNAILTGTPTYSNGTNGVGATLTEVGFGALSVDGASPTLGQRILVKNQADQTTNGVYTVTTVGSGIASYLLTRSTDYNTSADIYAGTTIPVLAGGTANADTQWTETTTGTLTIGSSNIVFEETSFGTAGPTSVSNSDGTLTISPTTGAVVASLNLSHSNIWSVLQTFGNASTTNISASNELNIPHSSTVPGLSSGDLYVNTNSTASSSVATSDGTNAHTLFAVHTVSTTLASSTLVYMGSFGTSGTTTLPVTQSLHSITIRSFGCATDKGTAWLTFGTGLASTTAVQCTSGGAFIIPASNNTFIGRQLIKMDIGTSGSSPNTITVNADVEDSN